MGICLILCWFVHYLRAFPFLSKPLRVSNKSTTTSRTALATCLYFLMYRLYRPAVREPATTTAQKGSRATKWKNFHACCVTLSHLPEPKTSWSKRTKSTGLNLYTEFWNEKQKKWEGCCFSEFPWTVFNSCNWFRETSLSRISLQREIILHECTGWPLAGHWQLEGMQTIKALCWKDEFSRCITSKRPS